MHSTMRDERGRLCLEGAMPPRWRKLHPVGRLDAETTGLLLVRAEGLELPTPGLFHDP